MFFYSEQATQNEIVVPPPESQIPNGAILIEEGGFYLVSEENDLYIVVE